MGQISFENLDLTLQAKINSGGSGGGSGITLPIKASDVTEEPNKVFVSSSQRAMIDANSMDISSQSGRIASVENTLSTLSTTDEKVKLTASDEAKYLSELLDNTTITSMDGKLTVESLRNLLVSAIEINFLQGASGNIQQQINNLKGVPTFRGVFSSLENLLLTPDPQDGQYAIVSYTDYSEYYYFYSGMWELSHSTSGSSEIDIATGTTGILPKVRYEKQNASETAFVDPTSKIIANNTQDAIVEVFRFADSLLKGLTQTVGSPLSSTDTIDVSLQKFKAWWAGLANAITNKGIATSTSNNGNEIIQKIEAIPNLSIKGTVKKKSKINVLAGNNIEVQLSSTIPLTDIVATLIEFIPGSTGIIAYELLFNNSDKVNFKENNFIEFDGAMKLKKEYISEMELVENWFDSGVLLRSVVLNSDDLRIDRLDVKFYES